MWTMARSHKGLISFAAFLIGATAAAPPRTAAVTFDSHGVFPDTRNVLRLDGPDRPWSLRSEDGAYVDVPARVPGDVLTDLRRSDVISDPYFGRNFLEERRVWMGEEPESDLGEGGGGRGGAGTMGGLEQRTRIWTYSTEFSLSPSLDQGSVSVTTRRRTGREEEDHGDGGHFVLVLEGIKMGASVQVNGVHLGNATDQFLRYTFAIPQSVLELGEQISPSDAHRSAQQRSRLRPKADENDPFGNSDRVPSVRAHNLTISFDPSIDTHGRFMACSGGWDWAPYSRAGDMRGSRVFSFGIYRPVYVVEVRHVSIIHVVPRIYYLGDYPREPMLDGPQGDFQVHVDVHIQAPKGLPGGDGVVLVRTDFIDEETAVEVPDIIGPGQTRVVTASFVAPKEAVKLWWPNGAGDQPLYRVEASFKNILTGMSTEWVEKRIAFRTCATVTVNDTDGQVVAEAIGAGGEGSGSHGMFFRVNGAAIWARGANVVPMDQLEGRLTGDAHRVAVRSAAAANMNMLRVWGGGMILPLEFYEACDEEGILLYHDMMFVEEQRHGPERREGIEDEIRFTVRELASHPSIVLWSGCNECVVKMDSATAIYATFVMTTVAEEDDTRSIWPSCPSSGGWRTGVRTIDSCPNGGPLSTPNGTNPHPLEVHGPYKHGTSTTNPGVNGYDDGHYDTQTPITITETDIGPEFTNHFVSEFGASVFSSFESMSALLEPRNWGVHGGSPPDSCRHIFGNLNECNGTNVLAERNYPCDNHVYAFFGDVDNDEVGALPFQRQLYSCLISQMLWMKAEIEMNRASNSFGTLIWQFNENWPTGGWGVIEYGTTDQPGQVAGGRWKPLMHVLERSLFRDVWCTCGKGGKCLCRNDGIHEFSGEIQIDTWNLISGEESVVLSQNLTLHGRGGAVERLAITGEVNPANEVLVISVSSEGQVIMRENVILFTVPKHLKGLSKTAKVEVLSIDDIGNGNAGITLWSNEVALYVVLTTAAKGRFLDNAFPMRGGSAKVIEFSALEKNGSVNINLLRNTLRVEHLGMYL